MTKAESSPQSLLILTFFKTSLSYAWTAKKVSQLVTFILAFLLHPHSTFHSTPPHVIKMIFLTVCATPQLETYDLISAIFFFIFALCSLAYAIPTVYNAIIFPTQPKYPISAWQELQCKFYIDPLVKFVPVTKRCMLKSFWIVDLSIFHVVMSIYVLY